MNTAVILTEGDGCFAVLFTAVILFTYRGSGKYRAGAVHSDPPDIREEYFKAHERAEVSCRSKKAPLTAAIR